MAALSTNAVINQIMHRFNLREYLSLEKPLEEIRDHVYLAPLLDDALLLIIQLVSALPLPAVGTGRLAERVALQFEKEFIHRLISGPKTFSQLQGINILYKILLFPGLK